MKHPGIIVTILFLVNLNAVLSQDYKLETVIQKGHDGAVKSITFSHDGKYIATGGRDKTAKLWEVSTGREMRTFLGHTGKVSTVCFSPDGKTIATGSNDKTVILWDVATGNKIKKIVDYNTNRYNEHYITSLSISPDKKNIAVGSCKRKVEIFNLATGKLVKEFKVSSNIGTGTGVDIKYSKNGKFLLIGEDNRKAVIINIKTGKREKTLKTSESVCGGCGTSATFSPDEKQVVAAFGRQGVQLFDTKSGKLLKTFVNGEKEYYKSVDFSSKGNKIAVTTKKSVKVFNSKTGKLIKEIKNGKNQFNSAIFSPDGKYLLTANNDGKAVLYKTGRMRKYKVFSGFVNNLDRGTELNREKFYQSHARRYFDLKTSVKLSPNGKLLIIGKKDSVAKVINFNTGRELYKLKGHSKAVICYDFSPNGKYIVTGSADKTVKMWETDTGKLIKTFKGHKNMVFSVNFSHNGKYIVSTAHNDGVIIWNIETGKKVNYLSRLSTFFTKFSPNDVYLFSGLLNKNFNMNEAKSSALFRSIVGHSDVVSSVDFSNDGKSFASSSWDGDINICEINTGYILHKLSGHTAAVNDVKFSSDDKFIFSGSSDGVAKMWDAKTGKEIKSFAGHKAEITSIEITPDDKILITCTIDGEIKVWNIKTGKEIYTYYSIMRDDFFVKTKEGYFDVSPGAKKHVFFVRGMQTYEIDQFFEKFYRPGLLGEAIKSRGIKDGRINILNELKKSPPPIPNFKTHFNDSVFQSGNITLNFTITDNGGGVSEIKILHNGKRIPYKFKKKRRIRKGKKIKGTIDISLISGKNTISLSSFSNGRIESQPVKQTVFYENKESYPNCYVLSIGINKYKNEILNLNYAKADAKSFTKSFKKRSKSLFNKVIVKTLYDRDAIKSNIEKSIDDIAQKAKPEDVFVFYYAGHGSMVIDEFYFIPSDCVRLYDFDSLKKDAILVNDMQKKISNIKALKQLLILDACQSGGGAEVLGHRGAGKEKAVAQLSRSAGIHVLASAGSEQYAIEFKSLGHGLFTYVLLQALGGKADGAPKDNKITVYELKSFIDDQVPEYTKRINGVSQYPYSFSGGNDFPVCLLP